MNGIGIGDFSRGHDVRDVQITVGTGRLTNANGFVGELDVQTIFICRRINGNGFDAHFAASADNTQCDFTAIGYKNLLKHKMNWIGKWDNRNFK